jgi:hypothetical protein
MAHLWGYVRSSGFELHDNRYENKPICYDASVRLNQSYLGITLCNTQGTRPGDTMQQVANVEIKQEIVGVKIR